MHLTLCFALLDKYPHRRFIDWDQLLRAYVDGRSSPSMTKVLDDHRRRCQACDQAFTKLRGATDALTLSFVADRVA